MTSISGKAITIIVMGVCGSGKTTFGTALSKRFGAAFIEGDDLHPAANITKMADGIPLEDRDRWPWLQKINQSCQTALKSGSVVITCSALKKAYRDVLRQITEDLVFIHLTGNKQVILRRMSARSGHFMPADLVDSQFDALESTESENDVLELDITLSMEQQYLKIEEHVHAEMIDLKSSPHLALIGLGVMGGNLASNIRSKGYLLETCEINAELRQKFIDGHPGKSCHSSLKQLVASLETPRCIFLLIKAGEPVDLVITELLTLLQKDDIVVDLGNSHYKDTNRRCAITRESSVRFVGCGISGGAKGARVGPALMPGGDASCYPLLRTFLADIAAKHSDVPCVTWIGPEGAGHFVKMVHNGIEYADMQLIAESYQIMRDGLGMDATEIGAVFARWNTGPLASYLIEATASIFTAREKDGTPLIDRILDKAGQKGTGGWTTEAALEYGVPATLITEAVFARITSSQKTVREQYANDFPQQLDTSAIDRNGVLKNLETALYCARVISYTQGFLLLTEASNEQDWRLNLGEIAGIWRAGCIIRGRILDDIVAAYQNGIRFSLLDAPVFTAVVQDGHNSIREVIKFALDQAIPAPAYSSSVAFFDSMRNASTSANLIQAQRDFFGAHTFERVDRPAGEFFHADWDALTAKPLMKT